MNPLRFLLLEGPGQVERLRAIFISSKWSFLINTDVAAAQKNWPETTWTWRKAESNSIVQSPLAAGLDNHPESIVQGERRLVGKGWQATALIDEQRPGRLGVVIEVDDISIALSPSPDHLDPIAERQRIVVLDASWTHIARFPEREEVREAVEDALQSHARFVYYVTNLPWDADIFLSTTREFGCEDRARLAYVNGIGQQAYWQAQDIAKRIDTMDMVLLGLVPGRDDRGLFQRLRSAFAERTEHVRAYPAFPLSTGPGLAREEAEEAMGMWLPTRVLIAGGPISEQILLQRYLQEMADNRGRSSTTSIVVGMAGTEYRLPSLKVAHQYHLPPTVPPSVSARAHAARAGLVIVTYTRDDIAHLTSVGLSSQARQVVDRLQINRRGKTTEQVVHEVEVAFTSRGIPPPAIRFVP
jgi:hypothetical protein